MLSHKKFGLRITFADVSNSKPISTQKFDLTQSQRISIHIFKRKMSSRGRGALS